MEQFYSILRQCAVSIKYGVVVLAVGFLLFALMEKKWMLRPHHKPWRATLLDLQYAFLAMLYPPFIYFILSAFFAGLALGITGVPHDSHIQPLRFAAQFLILLLVRDCLIYIRHRIFHLRPVWVFHSIHHSSEEVNWISAVRFHPFKKGIEAVGEILLFLACTNLGFDPAVLSAGSLVIGFYNFFIHSNLRWTFGPLRYVLVSPVFHRWHHSDLPAAADKNFAAMFSFLDLAGRTFYMPDDSRPHTAGLSAEEKAVHPRTLLGQILYPFRKR